MNIAEICWLVLLGGIVFVAVVSFLSSDAGAAPLPAAAQHVSRFPWQIFINF